MFTFNLSPHSAVALSALAVFASPIRADDIPVAAHVLEADGLQLAQGLTLAQAPPSAGSYFTLLPDVSYTAIERKLGGLKLRFGVLTSGADQLPSAQPQPPTPSGLVEVSRFFGGAALSVSMSQTREPSAYLGTLAMGHGALTSSLRLAGAVKLAPKWTLAGQAAYGVTPGIGSESRNAEMMVARTNAFSLALIAADQVRQGDHISLSLSQPARAYAGRIIMDMLTGASGTSASHERLMFSMVPIGRERRAQLYYRAPAGPGATFGVTLMLRRDPNNMVDVSTEKLILVRYTKHF